MSLNNTSISWTNTTWNPVSGCSKVSPGCDNCYAEAIAERFRGQKAFPYGFDVHLRKDKLYAPLHKRKSSLIFVNSMSDLFHKDIPEDYLKQIWDVMCQANNHIFQVLTKRPHRMVHKIRKMGLPLQPYIWLGVSAENQQMAESRIPELLKLNNEISFVSAEPLLEEIDLSKWLDELRWVIVGGESGPNRRIMDLDWVRKIKGQCDDFNVAFFYKQGNNLRPDNDALLDGVEHKNYPLIETFL